ncbi:hypothetical protein LCL98_14085 [Rossellomorea aquimaris]|nr:hypothetical protein [Rossellomorea aquimaris]
MKKPIWSVFIIICSFLMFSSNTLAASNLYRVQGDSMEPLLKDGDVIKLNSRDYKDGDMVLAKTETGGTIVKTLSDGKLVGENQYNSVNYNLEDVEILGSASKAGNYDSGNNVTRQAHALGVDSPIESIYAGREFVLMLHENTAVTGFGSNLADVLGVPGGLTKSTGELVKVSDLSGFEKIVTGLDYAFGLRPDDKNNNLYHLTRFDSKIGTNPTVYDSILVKDFALVGNDRYYNSNPHQGTAFIDPEGYVRHKGSDYGTYLGIGDNWPHHRYPGGSTHLIDNNLQDWLKVLEPDGEPIIYPTDTTVTPYFLSNEDNTATRTSLITPAFTITDDRFTIEVNLRDYAQHPTYDRLVNYDDSSELNIVVEVYDGNLTDTEIDSGAITPLYSYNNHQASVNSNNNYKAIEMPLDGESSKDYKVKITSSYAAWDMRIRDRKYFKNAERVLYRSERASFSIIDSNKNVFVNSYYSDGLVKPVTFTDIEAGVEIRTETAEGQGSNNHYGILDTNGRMWIWQTTNASMVNFPDMEGAPFYDNYEIIDMSIGKNFFLATSKHRTTGETNVFSWGENSFGQTGIGSDSTNIAEPSLVLHPNGNPLTDIKDIAAGDAMSAILQDTPNGQLIWTAGRNNRGQLGGGVRLIFEEPQLVPGLSNIDHVKGRGTYSYAFSNTDEAIYRFGGGVSYTSPYTFHTNVGYPKKVDIDESYVSGAYYGFITQDDTLITTGPMGNGGEWNTPKLFTGELWDSTPGTFYTEDNKAIYNGGMDRIGPVKDVAYSQREMAVIDQTGRLWVSIYSYPSLRGYYGLGTHYTETGELANQAYPYQGIKTGSYLELRPIKTDWKVDAPAIFEKVVMPEWSNYANRFNAVTTSGKLWNIYSYASEVTTPLNDIGIKEVFNGKYVSHLIDNNGDVWALGNGSSGRLGDGTSSGKTVPVLIDPATFDNQEIVYVDSGEFVTYFVAADGSVYASGKNDYRLIPNNDITMGAYVNTPVKVDTLSNIKEIYSGNQFALAVTNERKVLSWGLATDGSLGNGFTTKRNIFGTGFGNLTPELEITSPLKTYYLSENGERTITLEGTIIEHDQEDTSITTTLLGSEKEVTIDSTTWYQDNYNQVVPQDWQMSWDVSEFGDLDYQSLTKISALDGRGGIKEQFYSAEIIVDNEIPSVPTWGDNCLLDNTTGNEVSCQSTAMFQAGGTNGVNQPVRLYINAPQKIGDNKAPVYPQISYRVKTKGGFYINNWSDWETIKTQNATGFYYDVFAGFKGEAQFKVRSTDLADNVSLEHSNSMYTILTDAGAEIDTLTISSSLVDNQVNNTLEFNGVSHSGTTITTYNVKRKDLITGDWNNLTDPRGTWEGSTTDINTFTDKSPDLLGNTNYEYSVNAENSIGVGVEKKNSVITNPYLPENFMRKVDDNDHLIVDITQDKRNRGEILYRLVIEEVSSGEEKSFDYVSSSVSENVLFDVDNTQVPFNITNNKLKLTLLLLGSNGNFLTQPLDEDFVVNKRVIDDAEMPFVEILINEKFTQLTNDGVNKIDFSVFATDNVTRFENLEFQISHNGNDWYGQKDNEAWVLNHWTSGRKAFTEFQMGDETGRRALYVRTRDEASNLGFTITKITIADLANRGSIADTDPTAPTVFDARELTNSIKASNEDGSLHVNSPSFDLKIPIPSDGNLEEVQFTFDGVTWSPWERISDDGTGHHTKSVILPHGDGKKALMTRYRNKDGAATTVQDRDIINYTLDTSAPKLVTKTKNGPLITNQDSVSLYMFVKDNFSQSMNVSLDLLDSSLNYVSLQIDPDGNYYLNEGLNVVSIGGLADGRNEITLRVYDEAGNYVDESINIIKKAP